MRESVTLTGEMNELRREAQQLRLKQRALVSALAAPPPQPGASGGQYSATMGGELASSSGGGGYEPSPPPGGPPGRSPKRPGQQGRRTNSAEAWRELEMQEQTMQQLYAQVERRRRTWRVEGSTPARIRCVGVGVSWAFLC